MNELPDFETICETLNFLDDWEDRYTWLIDLGRALPPYPQGLRDEAHRVQGCTSGVWVDIGWVDGKLDLKCESDAHIVKGMLAVLYTLHAGKTLPEIKQIDAQKVFADLGLEGNLSPNRRNGFFAVATKLAALAGEGA